MADLTPAEPVAIPAPLPYRNPALPKVPLCPRMKRHGIPLECLFPGQGDEANWMQLAEIVEVSNTARVMA